MSPRIRYLALCIVMLFHLTVSTPLYAADPKKPAAKGAAAAEATPVPPYDRICQIDVHYIYGPRESELDADPDDETAVMMKVYYATISDQGMITEDIQKRLNTKLASVRAEAMNACRSTHQEQDGCIARKLASLSGDYPRVDFVRRKMLFESVRADCGNNLGTCLATESSEMKCWMNVPPEIAVPNEPKIEVAQPAKAEPDIEIEDVEYQGRGTTAAEEGDDTEDEDLAAEDAGGTAAGAADGRAEKTAQKKPKKKKLKKKKEEEEPASGQPTPEPKNPYSQPFSPL